MKAISIKRHGGVENLILGDAPIPNISPSQVLVEVHYAGVNRADVLQRKGLYPTPVGVTDILGLEFSGIVSQVGNDVKTWDIGDRVCSIVAGGGYAEFVKIEADHLIPVPEKSSLIEAAAIPETFLTSFQALVEIGKLKPNDKLLIHAGASGVGSAAIQMAKSIGAHVIVTASAPKHEYCFELGANECIDYKSQEFDSVIAEKHSEGINMIFDLVGASHFQKNLNSLGIDGRMVMIGFLGGVNTDKVNVASIVTKRLRISGSTLRSRSKAYKTSLIKAFSSQFLKDCFPFKTNVDQIFNLEDASIAHQFMEENKNKGKILLKVVQ